MSRLIHYEYQRLGKPVVVYDEWLVVDRPDVKVLLLERYSGKAVMVGGRTVLDAGAPIVWYVFPGAWHDVGRFHLGDGTFTGWYTNLTTAVDFRTATTWCCTDMYLDLWISVADGAEWLDEEEFAAAVSSGTIDRQTTDRVLAERAAIDSRVRAGAWPPAICREIDLERARASVGP